MIKIVAPEIERYLNKVHTPTDDPVLLEMESYAKENNFPIIGRLAGAFVEVMALSIGARRIFEFGSGFGYSAFWFSRAVGESGQVICTDGKEENVKRAKKYLEPTGRWPRIEYHAGWAQNVFKKQDGQFDLIFNDVDKEDYPEVWEMAKKKISRGGLYIADNCLWDGRVTQDIVTDDVAEGCTEAIKDHNNRIANDPDFRFFVNPVRDGLIVAYRL